MAITYHILEPMDNCLCLCELLKAAAAVTERELNESLSDAGVSHCQASILTKILASGPLTMSAVSKELCCHKSNVTQVVDGLAAKGLIARTASTEDRRVFTLGLTPKGKTVAQKAKTVLTKRAQVCIGMLTPAERKMLGKLLEKSMGK